MTEFVIKSPEGQSYRIKGPEGATREQAFGILQRGLKDGSIKPETKTAETEAKSSGPIEDIIRKAARGSVDLPKRIAKDMELSDFGKSVFGGGQQAAPGAPPQPAAPAKMPQGGVAGAVAGPMLGPDSFEAVMNAIKWAAQTFTEERNKVAPNGGKPVPQPPAAMDRKPREAEPAPPLRQTGPGFYQ